MPPKHKEEARAALSSAILGAARSASEVFVRVDWQTALWDWGDDITSEGDVDEAGGSVTGAHTYANPGVYTVRLTVTDKDDAPGKSVFQYVVVYDPIGGFVTGGGWINSLSGAYAVAPELTGKATFGFISKYKKGADTPTGETEFQFRVANLNFHSTYYQWLVVAGARTKSKGTGTINGAGNYGFTLTAIDGDIQGSGGTDKFRIKIWDRDSADVVVYDNELGMKEGADPTAVIGGGSIVIHKK